MPQPSKHGSVGPDTGMMLSTFIVEPDEPLATFTRSD
jgi:hypothetical protein